MAMQNMTEDEQAFMAAFNEGEEAPAPMAAEEPGGMPVTVEDAASEGTATAEGEPAAVAVAAEGEVAAEEPDADGPTDPKEIQRQKSWEGRLRAREAELAEREAKLSKTDMPRAEPAEIAEPGEGSESEAMEKAADQLAASGDEAGAEKVEQMAEQVESGDLTAEQAMKILSEDFGPEFVKMIEVIAGSKAQAAASKVAQEATGQLGQSVQEIIDTIVDDKARSHFETIAAKHPDFADVAATPEFNEFVKSYPGGEEIAAAGSAKDIVKMLDKYKSNQKPAEPDPAVDAAEGVRSSGMRLPEAPSKADGYEDAWSQF